MPTASHVVHLTTQRETIPYSPLAPSNMQHEYDPMPLRTMSLTQKIRGVLKYAWVRAKGGPLVVCLEVTHFCNARCDFCNFWKTTRSGKITDYDYIDALRRLNPFCVTLTGGEPTLNKHLPEVVRRIKQALGFVYIGMITHGSLLTLDKVDALWAAGLDQISISLNYMGPQHDAERGIKGLYDHLARLIPQLTARGMNIVLNTVIMLDNLDHLIPLAEQARRWGAKISYSCYSDVKNGNRMHLIDGDYLDQVVRVVDELIRLKPRLRNIVSSTYYLRRVPEYFRGTLPTTCQAAGKWLVHITPDGETKPCPDLPVTGHYSRFKGCSKPIVCDRCWYSCRGETQAALTLDRVRELIKRA